MHSKKQSPWLPKLAGWCCLESKPAWSATKMQRVASAISASGRSWRPVRIRVCQGHGRNRSGIRGPPVDPQAHGREASEGVVRRGRVKTLGGSRRTVNWRSPGHRPQPKTKSCHPPREPIDTSTAAGKCFLGMPGVFAEFETTLRRERQLEGIAKAKAAGIYK